MKFAPLLVLLLTGCAGSFEEAHAGGMKVGAPPDGEHCRSLDGQHRFWGGTSKFSAMLAGGAGLATLPAPTHEVQVGLAVGSVVLGAVAAGAGFVADDAAESWARDCSR